MEKSNNYYIKTNRAFSHIRKYGWIITVLIAIGGQWEPKLGLTVVLIMAGLTITAFFNGRYWCGNFCPHGSLFDTIILPVTRNKKIPDLFKSKVMIIGFFAIFMVNFMRRILSVSQYWGTYDFFDKLGYLFSSTYLIVLIVGGILATLINPRTWCQFCPMGTLQKLAYKLGKAIGITKKTEKKITISSQEKCYKCGKCAKVCPFQLAPYLEFSNENKFDNINCIKCSTCVANCPAGILSLKNGNETEKVS
ncbi:MAG: 4Fe-4S binding protein [Lutispora sp.]|jgi:ferredoxin-type protein NapH